MGVTFRIVPNKNGKWRVCIGYKELNKATVKYHFPLPFTDQVFDTLEVKKYLSFYMILVDVIKSNQH